eukprot:CAMPEP_0206466566 /NCGR_PEP_ID=MMETSP0324_2-20121206/28531_1 /ASSEMBLY_ACC=CAM_ASM_000836 /TAXON_ID=2866 /ORGANISM="Crypthecodinium cohnii, Strain Seligo" /LENGTH=428 /DNA_ID=CAMNT_0053939699 /DNA_START=12 /DNA_END=1298 /DNA_ORIENTATION=+
MNSSNRGGATTYTLRSRVSVIFLLVVAVSLCHVVECAKQCASGKGKKDSCLPSAPALLQVKANLAHLKGNGETLAAEGETCNAAAGIHCEAGLYCIIASSSRNSNQGVCTRLEDRGAAGEGQECVVGAESPCAEGLHCVSHPELHEGAGICEPASTESWSDASLQREAAGLNETCRTSVSSDQRIKCITGLVCSAPAIPGAAGTCQYPPEENDDRPAAVGEGFECNSQVLCDEGLVCTIAIGTTGFCQAPSEDRTTPPPAKLGETCNMTLNMTHQIRCEEGLVCMKRRQTSTGYTCEVPPPQVGEGEVCRINVELSDQIRCEVGLQCMTPPIDGANGTCRASGTVSEPEVVEVGETCGTSALTGLVYTCNIGLMCTNSTCIDTVANLTTSTPEPLALEERLAADKLSRREARRALAASQKGHRLGGRS